MGRSRFIQIELDFLTLGSLCTESHCTGQRVLSSFWGTVFVRGAKCCTAACGGTINTACQFWMENICSQKVTQKCETGSGSE